MRTRVFSEIHRLKKVLVHQPGREVDVIVPERANDLLFEDILFGEKAQSEHQMMCKVLHKYGVETFDTLQLLIEALQVSLKEEADVLIDQLTLLEKLAPAVNERLKAMSAIELGHALIEGVVQDEKLIDDDNLYLLRPIPNLMFARDPVIIAFDKIFSSSMAEMVRQRESDLMTFIFNIHPEVKNPENVINLHALSKQGSKLTLEGGDFLVINEETVAIAWSVRTSLASIHLLAGQLKEVGVRNLIVVKLPTKVSFIHLDTVFTRINHDECLIYPPLFAPDSLSKATILYFDLRKSELVEKQFLTIFDAFDNININLKPIYCGGKTSFISQKREQWTHGANAVCIAPGIIITYARNTNTIKELSKNGYLTISASEVIRPYFEADFNRKTAILLEGDELCRARGGPRCMTHPLVRE